MRMMKQGVVALGVLVAACGGSGAPQASSVGDDANAMMVSNDVVMSDEIGAENVADAVPPTNVAQ